MSERLKFPENPEKNKSKELCKMITSSLDVLLKLVNRRQQN
jgi:hypothetical protein